MRPLHTEHSAPGEEQRPFLLTVARWGSCATLRVALGVASLLAFPLAAVAFLYGYDWALWLLDRAAYAIQLWGYTGP
jgi:hypothetical protein